ncbi:hypothetical protein G9A89_008088 [Geosiphon pyriformis]|nr:hypothetical protein G9A89_008088 [Geosiphon pyriformis]
MPHLTLDILKLGLYKRRSTTKVILNIFLFHFIIMNAFEIGIVKEAWPVENTRNERFEEKKHSIDVLALGNFDARGKRKNFETKEQFLATFHQNKIEGENYPFTTTTTTTSTTRFLPKEETQISTNEVYQVKLSKMPTKTKKIRFDLDPQICDDDNHKFVESIDDDIFNQCSCRNGPSPFEYYGNIDNIFNQLMGDIDRWQKENSSFVEEPIEDIHQVLEQYDDIETKYDILLREYNSLKRKTTYLFTDNSEYLESQILKNPQIPLSPDNFHIFTRKEYTLFFTVIIICLFFVLFLGFYAVKETEYAQLINLSELSSPRICDTEIVISATTEPTYQGDSSKTLIPQKCFDLFFFHLCARNTP